MASDLQHCPACDEEYVAGVAACVECGGALQPGPLPRLERGRGGGGARPADDGDDSASAAQPSRLLGEMPGLQADHLVRALLREEIACVVECRGVKKIYAPDQPPGEPFAVTLPVRVYVPEAHHEAAQDILASLDADDVIGDQWSDVATDAAAEANLELTRLPTADVAESAPEDDESAADEPNLEAPVPESTSLRAVALIVIAAIVLLFLFGR
jgi:hypothetical protein